MNVLFVCVGNTGRSLIAERLCRQAAGGRHEVRSAGVHPGSAPEPVVVEVLAELGIDASDHVPCGLDDPALAWADVAVSMCAEAVCPPTPGVRGIAWSIEDPYGRPLADVRAIRDRIARDVETLLGELDPAP